MGLDVYLYTKAEREANDAHNVASEALFGRPDYDALPESEKKALYEALPSYASHENPASEQYPDHLFNRRYLRSSYNGGGFNRAVPEMVGENHDLYWIFKPMGREWDGDEGTLTKDDVPKLQASKARALEVAEELRRADRLRVVTVSPNFLLAPPTHGDTDALAMYRKVVRERPIAPDDWWSSRDMDVFGDGLPVLAAIPGKASFGVPGVHLIYKQDAEIVDTYIQSAEIVAEFCDEAISLIERDGSCSMSWSG